MYSIDNYCKEDCINTEEIFKNYIFDNFCETHDAKYGGSFLTKTGDVVFIKKVIYNKPKVVILWNDGTRSTASCTDADIKNFNFEAGLNIAINNRLYGYDEMNRLYDDWLPDRYIHKPVNTNNSYEITIGDVRKFHRGLAKHEWAAEQAEVEQTLVNYLESCGYKIERKAR